MKHNLASCAILGLFATCLCGFAVIAKADDNAKMEEAMRQQGIKVLKEEYNYSYVNDQQTETFIAKLFKDFYASLRECRPGVYRYVAPVMGLVPMTPTIKGLENGKCVVTTTNKAFNTPLECKYDPKNLPFFNDAAAEAMAQGKQNSYNSDNLTPYQKILKSDCITIVEGKPVSM